jgi:ketosteroid isomerase-like protein
LFCSKCGSPLQEGVNFCPACGNPLQNTNSNISPLTPTVNMTINAPIQNISSKNLFRIIGIVTCLVLFSCFIYIMFASNRPISTVEKFVAAINEKDINKAMKYMDPKYEKLYKSSSKLLSGILGTPELTDMADLLPGLLEIEGVKTDLHLTIDNVLIQDINGDKATIKILLKAKQTDENGNVTYDSGETVFILKKFSEGWRILTVH